MRADLHDRPDPAHLHARQFVVGPAPLLAVDDWLTVPLEGGRWLSHCPRLAVTDRAPGTVLGLAVATADDDDPVTWAGRWALIDGHRIRLDAAGTLGCYHRRIDGRTWASSSPQILRRIDPELTAPAIGAIERGRGMTWFPPPASGVDGMDRLLPSQVLDLTTGVVSPRPLLDERVPAERPYDEVVDELGRTLVAAVRGVAEARDDVWIALTGGQDSRLILAATYAAGIDATAFTFVSERVADHDVDLPPRLAAAIGVTHRSIALGPMDDARMALFDEHTAGHCVDGPRNQIGRGGWDQLPPDATALGGLVFEIGRFFYHRKLPKEAPSDPAKMAALVGELLPTTRPAGLAAWSSWVARNGRDEMDWRDRLYVEQRIGGWASSNAQGVDVTGRELVHLANETRFITNLLHIPKRLRRHGAVHSDLIARLAPPLAHFPIGKGYQRDG